MILSLAIFSSDSACDTVDSAGVFRRMKDGGMQKQVGGVIISKALVSVGEVQWSPHVRRWSK